jgi:predicted Zn-dependent protease
VPESQAEQAGNQAWQQITARTPETQNVAEQERARRVADRMLRAAGEDPSRWQVEVLRSDQINAFALPSRQIGVYEGMMRLASTDAELATVIGHEMGHVEAHHAEQRMSSEEAAQLGTSLLGAVLGGGQATGELLGLGAEYGILLPYSRNQEYQADKLGVEYMARAGYDPEAALTLWQKMEQAASNQPPAFLSDHPGTEDRLARLKAMMPQALAEYRATER